MAFVAAGSFVGPDEATPLWFAVEGGRIVEVGKGEPEHADATGWLVPGPVNAHTHIADTFLRDRPGKPRTIKELVGPGGWKHQQLAKADASQDDGALRLAEEMAAIGTSTFLDFREGGVEGARWLAGLDLPVSPTILGRPGRGGFDEDEAHDLLEVAHGVGLPGMRDMKRRDIEAWAEAAHDARKPFAVHVSEDKRDDLDAVLALEPTFVVHMVHATARDMDALADARLPVVLCPRSNAWFGAKPPAKELAEAGVPLCLGTDNGMLVEGNLLDEAKALRILGLDEEACMRAMAQGRQLAGLPWQPPSVGDVADIVVLPEGCLESARSKPALDLNPEYQ